MNVNCTFSNALLLLAMLVVVACDRQRGSADVVDPRSIVSPPEGVTRDSDVTLHSVMGMRGIVQFGDEALVSVYGMQSREWRIRRENVEGGFVSLKRQKRSGVGENARLLRVPDVEDPSGVRFYYFERTAGGWHYLAVCASSFPEDRVWPTMCDVTYVVGEKVVAVLVTEASLKRNGAEIERRVLSALNDAGAL